jgi:hypothetical protein
MEGKEGELERKKTGRRGGREEEEKAMKETKENWRGRR